MSPPLVSVSETMDRVERLVEVIPSDTYDMIGVRSFGKGAFDAGELSGGDTRYDRFIQVREGDLLYPKLMAWEGAFAIVPRELDGYFASTEFCTFELRQERLDSGYARHLLRWPQTWRMLASASIGTNVRRKRLHPDTFLKRKLPIPDLTSQHVIALRLDELESKVVPIEMSMDRSRADQLRLLLPAAIESVLSRHTNRSESLGHLVDFISDVYRPGDPLGPATDFVGLEHVEPHTGKIVSSVPVGTERGPKHRFAPLDITYPRLRPYQNKVWLADRHGLCSVDQYVLRVHPGVNPHLVAIAMRSSSFLKSAIDATSNLQLPRIRQKDLKRIPVPLVAELEETEIQAELAQLDTRITRAIHLRRINANRASALRESMLNQAFNDG